MGAEDRNIKELIRWARDYLALRRVQNPQVVAELIAEEITGRKRYHFYLKPEVCISKKQEALFKKNIRRCGRRIPFAYITGKQYFMGDSFLIRPGVFIPRPETEVLVEKAVQFVKNTSKPPPEPPLKVIDIGTGSGNIAISIAKRIKNSFIYATDISALALRVAKENAQFHGVSQRISLFLGDIFSALKQEELKGKVDLIISNPPYIEKRKMRYLPEEVKKEPDFALNGGERGLDFYQKIIPASFQWLKKNGALMLEVGYNQAEEVGEIIAREYAHSPQIFSDLDGIARVISIQKR